jgi:hypothetical protein
LGDGEAHKFNNGLMAPALMTASVCSEVPDTMLVSAQAASNWTFSS